MNPAFALSICLSQSDASIMNRLMGLDNHLKMSVTVGLIDNYSGASNYLNNQPNSWEVSQTLFCKVQSRKEFIQWKDVHSNVCPSSYGKTLEKTACTHIVRGFVYGAEAYCIITKDVGTNAKGEVVKEAKDDLNGLLTKMKKGLEKNQNLSQFQAKLREKQKLVALNCRVYSDLETVGECSIFDAYNHFYNLIQEMMTTTQENSRAVPISVLLFNVTDLSIFKNHQPARWQYRCLANNVIDRCSLVVAELDGVVAKTETFCLDNKELAECPSFGEFVWSILKFQQLLCATLKNAVLKARQIDGKDYEIHRILSFTENHPLFRKPLLEQWLRYKQYELKMTKEMTSLKKITLLANKEQLNEQIYSPYGPLFALVLFLPPLNECTNKIVEAMKTFIRENTSLSVQHRGRLDKSPCYDDVPWCMDDSKWKPVIIDKIRELVSHVKRSNYVGNWAQYYITFSEVGKEIGFSYSVYQRGTLIAENLKQLPSPPNELRLYADSSRKFTRVVWNYENVGYPQCRFLVQWQVKGDSVWKQKKTANPGETESIIDLKPNSVANIRVVAETCIGRSKFSDIVDSESVQLDEEETDQ